MRLPSFRQTARLQATKQTFVEARGLVRSFSKRLQLDKAGTKNRRVIDLPEERPHLRQNRLALDKFNEACPKKMAGGRFWMLRWELERSDSRAAVGDGKMAVSAN